MVNNVYDILEKAINGERLNLNEGVALLESAPLTSLGQVADELRHRWHPDNVVTFVADRNINYTNVCQCQCKFCAFYREESAPDAYILTREVLFQKIQETIDAGGTTVLIQGGLHPKLDLNYYINMLREIKSHFKIHIHSFSPPEICYMAETSGLEVPTVLQKLQEAGLDSLPGGGAEILVDRVRNIVSPNKIGWEQWMYVMKCAHKIGMKSTATMMFGHAETLEERVLHMVRVRDTQDETGGFTAFIPWSYQSQNTALGGETAGGVAYLKTIAVARVMLDNIPNIQASWVTQGEKLGQIALAFGANDFGSTMMEENVVKAAGVKNRVPKSKIVHCIKDAGFVAAERNPLYQIVKHY